MDVKMIITTEQQEKKVVTFNLLKDKLNMTAMIELGYPRDEISILFQKLQEASFGEHVLGKRGRNGVEKFIANDLCPETFDVILDKKPLKYKIPPKEGPTDGEIFEAIHCLPRIFREITATGKPGYVVSFSVCDKYLLLDKLADGGFETIDEAVKHLWSEIKDRVLLFKSKLMGDHEQIASIMRGKRFIELLPLEVVIEDLGE